MSQDPPYAPAPDYGAAPPPSASPRDEMSAPPQMNAFARLGNVFFGPGEVFEDVRRSPGGWWLPLILLVVAVSASGFVLQWKLGFTPQVLAQAATESGLEQRGKTMKDLTDAERQQVEGGQKFTEMIFRLGPVFGAVYFILFFGIASLTYWVILLVAQAKTSYFRVLSVVAFSYFAPNIVKAILQTIYAFLVSSDNVDAKTFISQGGLLTTSLSFLTSMKAHPALWTFLNWIDVFSIWFLVLLAIGFGAISLKRKSMGSMLPVAAAPYVVMMLLSVVIRFLTAG